MDKVVKKFQSIHTGPQAQWLSCIKLICEEFWLTSWKEPNIPKEFEYYHKAECFFLFLRTSELDRFKNIPQFEKSKIIPFHICISDLIKFLHLEEFENVKKILNDDSTKIFFSKEQWWDFEHHFYYFELRELVDDIKKDLENELKEEEDRTRLKQNIKKKMKSQEMIIFKPSTLRIMELLQSFNNAIFFHFWDDLKILKFLFQNISLKIIENCGFFETHSYHIESNTAYEFHNRSIYFRELIFHDEKSIIDHILLLFQYTGFHFIKKSFQDIFAVWEKKQQRKPTLYFSNESEVSLIEWSESYKILSILFGQDKLSEIEIILQKYFDNEYSIACKVGYFDSDEDDDIERNKDSILDNIEANRNWIYVLDYKPIFKKELIWYSIKPIIMVWSKCKDIYSQHPLCKLNKDVLKYIFNFIFVFVE